MPAAIDVRETYRDDVHVSGVFRNVIISYSLGEPNRGYMASWIKSIESLGRTYPRAVACIIIIDGSAKPPSEAIRSEIKDAIAKVAPHLRALAQVVEGSGFASAAKRSALSFIALVARFPFPLKIFGTRREAAHWVRERLSDPAIGNENDMSLDELLRACDAVSAWGKP